jgi:hypothetical protein
MPRREDSPLCNKCGRTCAVQYMRGDDGWDNYGTPITVGSGYASPVLPDGAAFRFWLCEPCVAEYMLTLRIPPQDSSGFQDSLPSAEGVQKATKAHWGRVGLKEEP